MKIYNNLAKSQRTQLASVVGEKANKKEDKRILGAPLRALKKEDEKPKDEKDEKTVSNKKRIGPPARSKIPPGPVPILIKDDKARDKKKDSRKVTFNVNELPKEEDSEKEQEMNPEKENSEQKATEQVSEVHKESLGINQEGFEPNQESSETNQQGSETNQQGSETNPKGPKTNEEDSESRQENLDSSEESSALEKEQAQQPEIKKPQEDTHITSLFLRKSDPKIHERQLFIENESPESPKEDSLSLEDRILLKINSLVCRERMWAVMSIVNSWNEAESAEKKWTQRLKPFQLNLVKHYLRSNESQVVQ